MIFSKDNKITKPNRWSVELTDFKICAYQRQTEYISRYYLQVKKMLNIYEEPLDNPKAQIVTNNWWLLKYLPLV